MSAGTASEIALALNS
ncbi:hypothetical protein [Nostoc commune]